LVKLIKQTGYKSYSDSSAERYADSDADGFYVEMIGYLIGVASSYRIPPLNPPLPCKWGTKWRSQEVDFGETAPFGLSVDVSAVVCQTVQAINEEVYKLTD